MIILFFFFMRIGDFDFVTVGSPQSIHQAVWDERVQDTLLQALIIFAGLQGVSFLMRKEEWLSERRWLPWKY